MMRLRWRPAVPAAALLLAPLVIPGNAAAILTYDFSLGANAEYNDNFYNDPEPEDEGQRQPVQEMTYTLEPALRLAWEAPHDRLDLGYRGEFSWYGGDADIDPLQTHTVDAGLSWRRWRPFFLEVRETLDRDADPREQDVQPQIDYTYTNELTVRAGLVREFGARGFAELAYRGELETYPDVDNADRILRNYGEATVNYRWNPLWSNEFRVSYGRIEQELAPDYDELDLYAGGNHRLSGHLALDYSLEWIRDSYEVGGATPGDQGDDTDTNLLATVELSGDLRLGGSWGIGYEETLDYLADGETLETGRAYADAAFQFRLGSTASVEVWHEARDYRLSGREDTAWGATVGARWAIARWLACEFDGEWSSTIIQEAGMADVEDDTIDATIAILAAPTRHLTAEAGYELERNSSTDPTRTYTSNRFYVSLTYHLQALVPGALTSFVDGDWRIESSKAPWQSVEEGTRP